jgi:hypothetical protein
MTMLLMLTTSIFLLGQLRSSSRELMPRIDGQDATIVSEHNIINYKLQYERNSLNTNKTTIL